MYDDYAKKPYVNFRDSQRDNAEYFNSKVYKDSTATILGYNSFMVLSESDFGTTKTYYSDEIKVNYLDFEGHKVGNWYNKLKEVDGAITLKTITEYKDYYEIQEAIKIDKRRVTVKEFEIPNKPVAASFTALDSRVEMLPPTPDQINCYQQKVNAVSKENGQKFISYITFLLLKDGEIKFIEPYEEDEDGFYKVAVDIIQSCGFKFSPGKIKGNAVDSQVYFPIEFLK